jgi:hypothetical protein
MQPFSFQHREQNISKRNYEIKVVILWETYISGLELQDLSLDVLFPFQNYKFGTWKCLAYSFLDHVIHHVIHTLLWSDELPRFIFLNVKSKNLFLEH